MDICDPFDAELQRIDTLSSIDSNATAPDLPGPGRNVGNLFDWLGSGLESTFNEYTAKFFKEPIVDVHDSLSLELRKVDTSSSIDSNATAPNLPGPGRNLGRLYDWLGSRVEKSLNTRAATYSCNPMAIAQNIRQVCHHDGRSIIQRHRSPSLKLSDAEERNLIKLCKKLIKCARFVDRKSKFYLAYS